MAAAAGESKPRRVVPGFGDISHEEAGSVGIENRATEALIACLGPLSILGIPSSFVSYLCLQKPYDFEKDVSDALGTWYWAGPGMLDLDGKFIGDAGAYRLARMIEERPKNLKYIHISSAGLTESGAVTVLSTLAKCPNLIWICISNNQLGEKGGEALVKAVKQCPALVDIRVDRCGLQVNVLEEVVQACSSLTEYGGLSMRANDFDDNGAKLIKRLSTRWSLSFSGTRMTAAGVIANHDWKWTLTGIPLGNDGVAKVLRDSDIAQESWVCMQGVGLTDVSALADALKDSDKIKGLDMSGNTIGDKGAVALAEALSKNGTLYHLTVKNCGIGDEGSALEYVH